MMSTGKTKKILLLFAEGSVRKGRADPEALQELLQSASLNQSDKYTIYISYARSLSYYVSNNGASIRDHRNHMNLEDYDFVYFRKAGSVMQQMLACATYLKSHNVPFYDREILHATSRNKLSQMFKLQAKQLPIPPTLYCRNKRRLLRLVTKKYADSFKFPIIAKATGASRGDANYLVKSAEELEKLLKTVNRHFLIQQFIPNDGDYRFFVVNGQNRGIIQRKATSDTHLSNTSTGGSAQIIPETDFDSKILMQAEHAARVFRRDCAGVDIMFDQRNGDPYILEVNRAPQMEQASFEAEKADWLMDGIEESISDYQYINHGVPDTHIGLFEWIKLVSPNGTTIKINAKIDTGAYNSSIHAEDIRVIDEVLYCTIAGHEYIFETFLTKNVKSSNGIKQQRYLVVLPIKIGDTTYKIKVTLTDRSQMRLEMLIGRRFLRANSFVVDVSRRYVASTRKVEQ